MNNCNKFAFCGLGFGIGVEIVDCGEGIANDTDFGSGGAEWGVRDAGWGLGLRVK